MVLGSVLFGIEFFLILVETGVELVNFSAVESVKGGHVRQAMGGFIFTFESIQSFLVLMQRAKQVCVGATS